MTIHTSYPQSNPPEIATKSIKDPIPELISKLNFSNEISVKIRKDIDNPLRSPKKSQIVHIFKDSETQKTFTFKLAESKLKENQKIIASKLKRVETYIIVTKNEDIITATPNQTSGLETQVKTSNTFQHNDHTLRKPILLFFMDKGDASLYLQEICKQKPRDSEQLGLKIKTVNVDFFYNLNRNLNSKVDSKLVADLSEIKFVMENKSESDLYYLHPKQRYSHNYFQGTPIYLLKYTKDCKKNLLTNTSKESSIKDRTVFFKWEDAMYYWETRWQIKNRNLNPISLESKNMKPNIELYNLESLLIEMEEMDKKDLSKYRFVPILKRIQLVYYPNPKEIQGLYHYSKLEKFLFNTKMRLKNLQRMHKNLVSLLTSDRLPAEENTW